MEKSLNIHDYGYKKGDKIEVEGILLTDLLMLLDSLLEGEIRKESKFKYSYVNEKGNVVKNVKQTDVEAGKLRKILDFEKTILEPTLDFSISEKGMDYAKLKNFLEGIHFANVQSGKAILYSELVKNVDTVEAEPIS